MKSQSKKDIQKEVKEQKEKGDKASQKAVELAKFAQKTKEIFESFQGEATAETAQIVERSSELFQANIEGRYDQAVQESENLNKELEQDQQSFEKGAAADRTDVANLGKLKSEAKSVGVSDANIVQAETSKRQEISFLDTEAKGIEKAQGEMKKKLDESKQRKQAARFKYNSKNSLTS